MSYQLSDGLSYVFMNEPATGANATRAAALKKSARTMYYINSTEPIFAPFLLGLHLLFCRYRRIKNFSHFLPNGRKRCCCNKTKI
jgi:hypothetical protein